MDESFFVGGRYVEVDGMLQMVDQAYVRYLEPSERKHPYPIVLIHGGGSSGAIWEMRIEGRPSWANLFYDKGFAVCVIDQPGRGRSAHSEAVQGPLRNYRDARWTSERSARSQEFGRWPQARLHTQFPGSGQVGDPIFDQIYAVYVSELGRDANRERINRATSAALLDKIGPAILLTHSQSGPFGWHMADVRPDLAKAIVALEPVGPPFFGGPSGLREVGPPNYWEYGESEYPFGITMAPLTYAPALGQAEVGLQFVKVKAPSGDQSLVDCYLQQEPARQLVNLRHTQVLVVTGEASHHSGYDYGTVAFLRQAGVAATHMPLGEKGIRGNSHMMMLEKNSQEIAGAIIEWIEEKVDVLQ